MARPLWKRVGYDLLHTSLRLSSVLFLRVRCEGRQFMPREGSALVCSNHQSTLDPPLIGMAVDRRLNFLAKQALFDIPLLKQLIFYLDAIPLDRDGLSLSGIKETLRRLKQEEAVLIFPEGTRSRDGKLIPLKPGFIALARRSKAPLVPVAIDGTFRCWPSGRLYPWPAPVAVVVGEPISAEAMSQLTDQQLLAELSARIESCFAIAQQRIGAVDE